MKCRPRWQRGGVRDFGFPDDHLANSQVHRRFGRLSSAAERESQHAHE